MQHAWMRHSYEILVGKSEGRPRRRWKTTKIDLGEMGLDRMNNTQVAQDRALLKTAIQLRAPEMTGNLLTT